MSENLKQENTMNRSAEDSATDPVVSEETTQSAQGSEEHKHHSHHHSHHHHSHHHHHHHSHGSSHRSSRKKRKIKRFFGKNKYKTFIEINFAFQPEFKPIFEDGFAVLNWGLMYREERTPEEIYSEYYDTDDLIKNYNIEEKANAYNIETTNLGHILNKVLEQPKEFFTRICDKLTKEELLFILSQLENKSCTNCSNQNCAIIGHINFGKSRKIQGTNCDEWINKELIGRAKVLRETDINKLK